MVMVLHPAELSEAVLSRANQDSNTPQSISKTRILGLHILTASCGKAQNKSVFEGSPDNLGILLKFLLRI